jgi:hypothetical protein
MSWGQMIIALLILLGAGFGAFILLRLRAEPVDDPDDLERVRLIKEAMDSRKSERPRSASLPAMLAEAFLSWTITVEGLSW